MCEKLVLFVVCSSSTTYSNAHTRAPFLKSNLQRSCTCDRRLLLWDVTECCRCCCLFTTNIPVIRFRIKKERIMKTTLIALAALFAPTAAFAPTKSTSSKVLEATREEILSEPDTIEFGKIWDPCGLSELGSDETIAWFRHAEIKHGRVAMAAFVGWWAVGAGVRFPGELSHGLEFSSIPSKGLEAWDAIPGWGKAQMLLFAGLVEFHDELFYSRRSTHYMRGGTPGKVSYQSLLFVLLVSSVSLSYAMTFLDFKEHGSRTF